MDANQRNRNTGAILVSADGLDREYSSANVGRMHAPEATQIAGAVCPSPVSKVYETLVSSWSRLGEAADSHGAYYGLRIAARVPVVGAGTCGAFRGA